MAHSFWRQRGAMRGVRKKAAARRHEPRARLATGGSCLVGDSASRSAVRFAVRSASRLRAASSVRFRSFASS